MIRLNREEEETSAVRNQDGKEKNSPLKEEKDEDDIDNPNIAYAVEEPKKEEGGRKARYLTISGLDGYNHHELFLHFPLDLLL